MAIVEAISSYDILIWVTIFSLHLFNRFSTEYILYECNVTYVNIDNILIASMKYFFSLVTQL